MKQFILCILASFMSLQAFGCNECGNYNNEDFQIKSVRVEHSADIASTIWEITVNGTAGQTKPVPAGQLNGAPVLGYVFRLL